jgi:alpha-N-arabinofuranosidase
MSPTTLRHVAWLVFSVCLLRAETLSRYVSSSAPKALITVAPRKGASFRIPRTIYGTFLEHIGNSVFGGLSAQLLDNPSLEPYPASPEVIARRFSAPAFRASTHINLPLPWLPLRRDGRRYEQRSGNAANSSASLYVMGLPGREVGIRQPLYLPIEREREYRGSLFALAVEGAAPLSVTFRRHDHPDEILARADLQVANSGRWIKLPFVLKLRAGVIAPMEIVDYAVAVNDGGRVSLDQIHLYPADAPDGFEPDVVRYARELRSPLLRYGGNFSSGYHWRDGVGPLDQRPTRLNAAWGIPEYNEFGTGELMEFCRLTGSLPQICLNLGTGSVEEARDWVEYCQGAPGSPGGRRRSANGHTAPYAVGAWELGNELYDDSQLGWYTPQAYARRYLAFFQAIRPLVPSVTPILATGGEINAFKKWNGALLDIAGSEVHYVTTHLVADLEDVQDRNAGRDAIVRAALALPVGVGRALEGIRDQIDANPVTRGHVKAAYTEWLFRSPPQFALPSYDNMGGAVIAAGWLNMLLAHSDFIPIANMTGLMEFGGIWKQRGRVYVTPQYWVMYLYSRYAGDTIIETDTQGLEYDVHRGQMFAPEIAGVPFLDVLATVTPANGEIALFVVNRNEQASRPAAIRIDDFRTGPDVRVLSLYAGSMLDKNDEEHQQAVRPRESKIVMNGSSLDFVFPPGSVTVLLFPPGRE